MGGRLEPSLKRQLIELIDHIADLERKKHQLDIEGRDIARELALIEAKVTVAVSMEKDRRDKPAFSNLPVRDAERIVRLEQMELYRVKRADVDQIRDEIRSVDIEIQRLQMQKGVLMLDIGFSPPKT